MNSTLFNEENDRPGSQPKENDPNPDPEKNIPTKKDDDNDFTSPKPITTDPNKPDPTDPTKTPNPKPTQK